MAGKRVLVAILLLTAFLTLELSILGAPQASMEETPVEPLLNATATPIPSGLPWYSVVVIGDNRPSYTFKTEFPQVFYEIVDEVSMLNPYAVVGTGDHVGEGSPEQYRELYRVMSQLHNVWLAPGNHDLHVRGALENWRAYVGPDVYCVKNPFPGWSFVFTNTEIGSLESFINETREALEACSGDGHLALVLHRPLDPFVNHNLNENGGLWIPRTRELIEEYNVSLVLQGHWHGYATVTINGVEYIIAGGGGAPLANYPTVVYADDYAMGKYNYLVMTFYPNGTYTRIAVNPRAGDLNVSVHENTVLVVNTKQDVHGDPIALPVIAEIDWNGTTALLAAFYPANSTTNATLVLSESGPIILANATIEQAYLVIGDKVYVEDANLSVETVEPAATENDSIEDETHDIGDTVQSSDNQAGAVDDSSQEHGSTNTTIYNDTANEKDEIVDDAGDQALVDGVEIILVSILAALAIVSTAFLVRTRGG